MAETVLYLLNSTDDSTRIAIQPRTYDGVGGVQRNTSLTLYGNNAPRWGEKFNENFYHLLENFAVNEATGELPLRPQDETDIGVEGLGLNLPILGQTWYNKSRDALFLYTSNGFGGFRWTPATSIGIVGTTSTITALTSNRIGDLSYSTNDQVVKIWTGSSWVNVAANASVSIVNLNDLNDVQITNPSSGQVLKYNGSYWYNGVDLQASGGGGSSGTVTSISGSGSVITSPALITTSGTISLVNDSATPGASRYYGTNSSGTKGFHPLPTGGGGGGGVVGITDHGLLTGLADDDHPQYLLTSGARAMTGTLSMGTNYITNVIDPVNPQDGATKAYVDSQAAGGGGGALLASGIVTTNNASVSFPGGYNSSTCYIITSPTFVDLSGGAGIDEMYSYATVSGGGWTIRSQASRENQGSFENIQTSYWILKN